MEPCKSREPRRNVCLCVCACVVYVAVFVVCLCFMCVCVCMWAVVCVYVWCVCVLCVSRYVRCGICVRCMYVVYVCSVCVMCLYVWCVCMWDVVCVYVVCVWGVCGSVWCVYVCACMWDVMHVCMWLYVCCVSVCMWEVVCVMRVYAHITRGTCCIPGVWLGAGWPPAPPWPPGRGCHNAGALVPKVSSAPDSRTHAGCRASASAALMELASRMLLRARGANGGHGPDPPAVICHFCKLNI